MLNGTPMDGADMIVAERNHQAKRAKEQSQAFEQNKGEKKGLVQQPEIKPAGAAEIEGFRFLIKILQVNVLSK
ncbi:hypothetical protein [Dyadobacter sp. CY326]|uniref:hypothetical protein n=1 Tax=Dyadobacter sp. CY326 TaxID=2907300 RepID=UPI001F43F459|nr:hypothetical protein [Dyadobacter sp. CY326]MCE7065755.1 hypothetical protein [Dyadobacter sp. CY326]